MLPPSYFPKGKPSQGNNSKQKEQRVSVIFQGGASTERQSQGGGWDSGFLGLSKEGLEEEKKPFITS